MTEPIHTNYNFELGETLEGLVNVEEPTALGVPPSPWTFKDGAEQYTAGMGKRYVDGYPQTTWHFDYLPEARWQWLMEFFEGPPAVQSVTVFMRTRNNAAEYEYYQAIMHKPTVGERASRIFLGFSDITVEFTHLVKQEVP